LFLRRPHALRSFGRRTNCTGRGERPFETEHFARGVPEVKTFARRGRARFAWGPAAFAALLACGPEDTDGGQDLSPGTGGVGEETGGSTAAGGASTGGSASD